MRVLALLLLSCVGALAQGGSYCTMSTWEPRNIKTKAGLVASYDPGNTNTLVHNGVATAGTGVSAMSNRVTQGTADLLQGTAANQPLISRADNKGNLLVQSEAFSTTWTRVQVNAFGANDSGTNGAGSFANTARTLDPLGGSTADFIQEDATVGGLHYVSQTITLPAGSYSFSCSVKPSGRSWVYLNVIAGADQNRCFFDTQNGVVGTASNSGAATGATGSITAEANGFYRCTLTGTQPTGGSTIVSIRLSSGDTVANYNGNNTSGLFLWGASLTPSSWTPVTGTSAALGYVQTTTVPIFPGLGGRSVLYFDGVAYYMKTAAFTLNQPEEVYLGVNQWTWTDNDIFFDGEANFGGRFYQRGASPQTRISSDGVKTVSDTTGAALGTWGLQKIVFNGANSSITVNSGAPISGDAGAGNMGGFTLGRSGGAGTAYPNILVSRALLCNKTNAPAEANYLRWGLMKQASLQ